MGHPREIMAYGPKSHEFWDWDERKITNGA